MEIFDLIKKTYQGQVPKGMFTGSQPELTNQQQIQKDVKPITDSIVEGFKNPNETPFKYLRIKNYNAYPQHDIRSQKPIVMEQGGNVPTNNSLNVMAKQQFNRVDPNLSNMTPNFQKGGEVGSNLGQLAKAAFQMANELKKQGAITEVAGEQVIAQAFQQTPEAAKMFVEAAQKQDVQTIVQLFTKLGIVK